LQVASGGVEEAHVSNGESTAFEVAGYGDYCG